MPIKIGISSSIMHPESERKTYPFKTLHYLVSDLHQYISAQKALPMMIPPLSEEDVIKEFVNEMDGLILQGGVDMNPHSYGEDHLNCEEWPGDRVRDAYELYLVELFVKAKKPILGICRGLQVLNVYFGGTLYQDLPTLLQTSIHRNADLLDQQVHRIKVEKNGIFSKIYQAEIHQKKSLWVNSLHHQGIKKLGDGLKIEARSTEEGLKEGLIEAFSYHYQDGGKMGPEVLAVQWHPEYHFYKEQQLLNEEEDLFLPPEKILSYFLSLCAK